MKENRKFLRQCAVCKKYKIKSELIRITKDYTSGELKINNNSDTFGRSVYICKKEDCIDKALKKKKIEYYLKSNISDSLKKELYSIVCKLN